MDLRPSYINVCKLTTIAQEKLECVQPQIKKQLAELGLTTTAGGRQPAQPLGDLQSNFCQTRISINSSPTEG